MSAAISPKKDGEIQKVDIVHQIKAVNFLKASENLKGKVGRRSQLNKATMGDDRQISRLPAVSRNGTHGLWDDQLKDLNHSDAIQILD
jgi:hypothetical protein